MNIFLTQTHYFW